MAFDTEDLPCPKCGESCNRDSVDVGVGVIYGPWGCACGWSEDPQYDCSDGPSPAQIEGEKNGRYVDSTGNSHSVARIAENLERFGIQRDFTEELFRVKKQEDGDALQSCSGE